MDQSAKQGFSRREFVRTTAAATAGLATVGLGAPGILTGRARTDLIRVGLIGCGGRGTGAAHDHLRANENVELVALGDVFADRLEGCRESLQNAIAENPDLAPKYKVTDELCFTGWDAYQSVIESDVDLVLCATPPAFAPRHIAAVVDAGKHLFSEKPVAVDPAGVRSVLASYEVANEKRLGAVVGTQRRHDPAYRAVIDRIHDGAMGEVVGGQIYWNQGLLWSHEPRAEWSDMEWQLRNWLYFTWLSGDHIVEQHVHQIDVANWVLDAHPVKAVGVGGRQVRTDPVYGHIFDHFAIDFEYPNGVHIMSMARQQDGTAGYIGQRFAGTRGRTDAESGIDGERPFAYAREGERVNPYVQEHANLVDSIRAGDPINELRQIAESTLTAIMGREAAYTGQEITWDEVLNADQKLGPPELAFGSLEVPPVPVPGQTKLDRGWME